MRALFPASSAILCGLVSLLASDARAQESDRLFRTRLDYQAPPATGVVVADFNRDGRDDVAVSAYTEGRITVFFTTNDEGHMVRGPETVLPAGSTSYGLAGADFNKDGSPDLAVADPGAGIVWVLYGSGDGTFVTRTLIPGTVASPIYLATGDFNGDGSIDVAAQAYSTDTFAVMLNDGTGELANATATFWAQNTRTIAAGDVDGDAMDDIVLPRHGAMSVHHSFGDGTFGNTSGGGYDSAAYFSSQVNAWTHGGRLTDLDADGNLDFVGLIYGLGAITMLGDGAGSFATARYFTGGAGANGVFEGDFTGDSLLDVIVINNGYAGAPLNGLRVLAGDGNGGLGADTDFYAVAGAPWAVQSGYLDGDAYLDLAVATQSGLSVWLTGGTPTPRPPPEPLPECDSDTSELDLEIAALTLSLGECAAARTGLAVAAAACEATNDDLESQIASCTESANSVTDQLGSCNASNESLSSQLQTCNDGSSDLQLQLVGCQEARGTASEALTACNEHTLRLVSQLDNANASNAALSDQLSSCTANAANLTAQLAEANATIGQLRALADAMCAKLPPGVCANLMAARGFAR